MYLGRFPTMAELGRTPNPWQLRCFQRLRALLHVCGSVPGDIPLILGRSGFEFGAGLFQLEQFMAKTPELLDPYCAPSTAKMKFDKGINSVSEFPQLEPYKSLDADRLKLVGRGKWPMGWTDRPKTCHQEASFAVCMCPGTPTSFLVP